MKYCPFYFLMCAVFAHVPTAGAMPDDVEPGAFSRTYLNPPELQFSCTGTVSDDEERYRELLTSGAPANRLAAAKALWRGHSRRYAAEVLKYLSGPPPGGEAFRALQQEVNKSLLPDAIRRELKDGDYLWGTWLAFLRPHKDIVPALLAGLKDNPDYREEIILALGNSGDPRAFDPLLKLVLSRERVTAGFAAKALGYLGDAKAESALIEAIGSDDNWLQLNASGALADIGTPKALPHLEKLANTQGYTGALNVRRAARKAIVGIERRHLPPDPARWPAGPEANPVATLKGHSDMIWAIAFSSDGKALASVGDDRAVRIWDATEAKAAAAFIGRARQMMMVAFVDRGTVATAGWGDDGSVRLLDTRSGREMAAIRADDGGVGSLAVSRDGKRIAVTGSNSLEDEVVQVFDVGTRKFVTKLPKASSALAFAPDGKALATTSVEDPGNIQLWDLEAVKVVATLRGHPEGVMTAAFSADGQTLASGGDWTLRIWDVRTGKATASFRGDSDISSVAFSPDGRSVAAAEVEGPVRIWDITARKATALLKARGPVAYSPDGSVLATASEDGTALLLWVPPGRVAPKK